MARRRFRGLTAHGVHQVVTGVHGRPGVDGTVQAVTDAVVSSAGFGVAVVSVVRSGGMMETVAVAGNEEARAQLLGVTKPRHEYDAEFAVAESWGTLLFVPHERLPDAAERGWIPQSATRARRRSWHPLDALYAPLRAASGELVGVLSVDLPDNGTRPGRRQRELLEILAIQAGIAIDNARLVDQLRAGEKLFRLAFDGTGTGMALISLDESNYGRYVRVNPTFSRIVGRPAEEVLGMTVDELTHPDDRPEDQDSLRRLLTGEIQSYQREKRYLRPDGSEVWTAVTVAHVGSQGGSVQYAIGQVEDITGRRAIHQDLMHRADHDPLTTLPNRAALIVRIGQSVGVAAETGRPGAVLFVDLDGFKYVNDEHGHLIGDQVLATIASRLAAEIRQGDLAGRIGGDEFLVVADDLGPDEAEDLSRRLGKTVAEPVKVPDASVAITASIGWTPIPVDGSTPDELIKAADQSMYNRKNHRRNTSA